eukprot:04449.XXX_115837_114895_1 [CDS] Oithona nana genome sequencing.
MTTKWQKKIVSLAFIAVLSILLLSNAFVTLWIMTAIGFSTDGLPSLKVGSKNLHAEGNIFAMKSLFASRIMDYNGLIIQAFKNLSLVANSPMKHSSALFINENEVILASKRFVIMDSAGNIIFSTTPTETSMSAKKMKISEIGGIQFSSSIETQNIRSGPGNSLEVASPVGHLKLSGPQKVDLASFGGSVDIFGLQDITLGTKGQGQVSFFSPIFISLNSGTIKMPALVQPNLTSTRYFRDQKVAMDTYQLCSCSDGKLFMASPNSLCLADYHICNSKS